jgi:hypothetical protein
MKELINIASDPVYSFTGTIIAFLLGIKYIDFVGSKKFFWISVSSILGFFVWACFDEYFRAIITWPDNVPISILLALVFWTTWYAIYKGVRNDKRIKEGLPPLEGTPENREKVWSWPNLVYTELFAIILGTVFLVAWSILLKAPLEEPANPTWAPNPAKAPWYFLGLQEMLVYFDPWLAGVLIPGLILVGLIAIPYLDMNPKGNGYYTFHERKFAISSFLFGWLVLWIFLIIVGTFLRGPNWTFYGPFEFWDSHKVVAANNINLSEIFWIKALGQALPQSILLREVVGVLLILAYFVAGPILLTKYWGKKYLSSMGQVRYYVMIFLVLFMMSLPIKMYLRWFINLKYLVFMPEFELNI